MSAPECPVCLDVGYITVADYDGSGYETACPEGCDGVVDAIIHAADCTKPDCEGECDNAEVPY